MHNAIWQNALQTIQKNFGLQGGGGEEEVSRQKSSGGVKHLGDNNMKLEKSGYYSL